jgi:Spy/CpxP family protein refolding chaperone
MRSIYMFGILILLLFGALGAAPVAAQERPNPPGNPERQARPMEILAELGLTRAQMQQIRRINEERRNLFQQAQVNLREANLKLDQAIYADTVSEEQVKSLMRETQAAQGELLKVRTMTEYQIRNVLTADQLKRFRDLRERFNRRMEDRRQNNVQRPRENSRSAEREAKTPERRGM